MCDSSSSNSRQKANCGIYPVRSTALRQPEIVDYNDDGGDDGDDDDNEKKNWHPARTHKV